MAADVNTALAATGQLPPDLGVTAADTDGEANPAAVEAITSNGAAPTALDDVTAEPLGGLAAAGVHLAKLTMAMISGAVLVLTLMLIDGESRAREAASSTSDRLLTIVAAPPRSDPRVATVVQGLRGAATDATLAMPAADAALARSLIDEALKNPAITPTQRASLDGRCIPVPTGADRPTVLQACAATLEALFADSGSLAQRVAFMQAAQKAVSDEQAARRAFWLQVAQLLLINLLLPILTGLLGYIFGTQQATKES